MKEQEPTHKEELDGLPHLQALQAQDEPFQLPSGYFDSFAKRLPGRQELAEMPRLRQLNRQAVFVTPETYFETLPQRVQAQLGLVGSSRLRRLAPYWIPLAIAAAVVLLFWLRPSIPAETDPLSNPFAGFSEAEMIEAMRYETLETETLLTMLNPEDLVYTDPLETLNEDQIQSLLEELDPAALEATFSTESLMWD